MDTNIQNDYTAAKKIGEQFLQAFFAKGEGVSNITINPHRIL